MNARWMFAAALALGAATARAQAPERGRGGPPDAARMMNAQNPVAMLLEHSGDLALTSAQSDRIAAIRQQLDVRSRPLAAQLDSMRPRGGPDGGPPPRLDPASLSDAQRDSMMTRRRAMGAVMAQVRDLQQAAKADAWSVLTDEQRRQADALEQKMRDETSQRRDGDDRGGRGRRGGTGGRGGRGGHGGMGGMGGGPPR